MLLVSRNKQRAVNVPVLLPGMMAFITGGAVVGFVVEPGVLPGLGVLLGLSLLLVVLSELRWARVRGAVLTSRNLFGQGSVPIAEAAIGIEVVRTARGGPSYHLYALAGDERVELATKWTHRGAERARQRLEEALLPDAATNPRAKPAREEVASREAGTTARQRAAKAQMDAYYASGKHRWVILAVVVGILAYALVVVLVTLNWG